MIPRNQNDIPPCEQYDNKLSWECHTRNPSWVGQIKSIFQAGTCQILRGDAQNLVQNFFDQNKSRPPKIVSKKFCQNWVSNSWNIHDMGKFCQDQCFLDKCDHYSWNRGSQELPLKFGQNWVSNSWNIAYMDKCRQDKCCMEKMWLWQLASLKGTLHWQDISTVMM